MASGAAALALTGAVPAAARVQQAAVVTSVVFDGVTVVDVEHGKLLPTQRVVVAGNRIQAVGPADEVRVPQGAQLVAAQGKYLIPGLWDMHVHTALNSSDIRAYRSFIIHGVTGVREAGPTLVPLETLHQWRREIAAGAYVGPRSIFAGAGIRGQLPRDWNPIREDEGQYLDSLERAGVDERAIQSALDSIVLSDGRLRHLIDSLQAAGADFIKILRSSSAIYFAIAAEARRAGIPFGGHADQVTAIVASDSGASLIDHLQYRDGGMYASCMAKTTDRPEWLKRGMAVVRGIEPFTKLANIEQCRAIAERFRRNGTWWIPALTAFYSGNSNELSGLLSMPHQVSIPLLAGTDNAGTLHSELKAYVTAGLTPLEALQAATLNPAKYLRGTDSLGTVAPGKLADLVLLDADPLADITNTKTIRAVVANGRYFDRTALDSLSADGQAETEREP